MLTDPVDVEAKLLFRPDFDEARHPRDSKGRFIEIGAHVNIFGGGRGIVLSNAGGGRIDVRRDDGKVVRVHRNYLTVTSRPGGGEPTDDVSKAAPTPLPPAPSVAPKPPDGSGGDLVYDPPDEPQVDAVSSPAAAQSVHDAAHPPHDTAEEVDTEVTDAPTPTEYDLRASSLDAAVAKIDQANRRAERTGIQERIGYSVEHYQQEVKTAKDGTDLPVPIFEDRVKITLDRPSVKIDGWTFVATLTWDPEAGLVTRTVPDAHLQHRPEARRCDVCKSIRDRKDTYVVQSDNGEEKQVGSNCLTQFLGIQPSNLWMLDWDPEFPPDGEGGGGPSSDQRYAGIDVLTVAATIVDHHGFVSRGQAQSGDKQATADEVNSYLTGAMSRSRDPETQAFARYIADTAPSKVDRAQDVRDFARTIDGDSDYATNLRAVANAETVDPRNVALLVSAVGVKDRNDEKVAAQKAVSPSGSQPFGKEGDKIKDLEARVVGVRYIDGNYGTTTLITFVTKDGNVAKWFASGYQDEWSIDDEVVITGGSVKGHGEFRGVPETNLTRVKLRAGGAAGEAAAAAAEQAKQDARKASAVAKKAAKIEVPEGFVSRAQDAGPPEVGDVVRVQVSPPPKASYDTITVTQVYDGGTIVVGRTVGDDNAYSERYPLSAIVALPTGKSESKSLEPDDQETEMGTEGTEQFEDDDEVGGLFPQAPMFDEEGKAFVPFKKGNNGSDPTKVGGDGKVAEAGSGAAKVKRGDFVSFSSGKGRVDLIVVGGVVPGLKDGKPVFGSKTGPAARVVTYAKDGDGWKATAEKVGLKASDLTKIDDLPAKGAGKAESKGLDALVALLGETETKVTGEQARMAYERGLGGWPGPAVTTVSRDGWALGRTKALLAAAEGHFIAGFADEDLLPEGFDD